MIFVIENIDIKYQAEAKKYAFSFSSNGFLKLFSIVGINQNTSTIIKSKTDKIGLSEKIQRIIEINHNNNENESDLDIFLLHFLKEIKAINKHKNATNHILNAQIQALSYIWMIKIIRDISHHINQDTTCGFDSHFIILLK